MHGDRGRRVGGFLIAGASHAALLVALVFAARASRSHDDLVIIDEADTVLVWVNTEGPGGGGGGGGNKRRERARPFERRGNDRLSVPAAPPDPAQSTDREARVVDRVIIPARPLGSALEDLPGLIGAPDAAATLSQGPGDGGGGGTGRGPGSGDGDGPGLGPGRRGGTGGDVYQPGNGVTMPVAVHVERPRYSTDAMRARVQGTVLVECVVRPKGNCTDIHVVRSLDPRFGLDAEAAKAAALWRFRPGMRSGEPVPVVVRIELEFNVR